jgi:hypothetical protein
LGVGGLEIEVEGLLENESGDLHEYRVQNSGNRG